MQTYINAIDASTKNGDIDFKKRLPAKAGETPALTRSGIEKACGILIFPSFRLADSIDPQQAVANCFPWKGIDVVLDKYFKRGSLAKRYGRHQV